ncbi:OLC1v1002051C1 [Oldenlandia corymbosa var. corymbosa]|uniref:OLC1v1002051C1 n=1 Tax=Oldenlandia corymbosa var. corymbosa TaxID=529605 RepID=A0AAV1D7F7_OLDCO|nr:OLC1v1002051C1 [Oldenlandia corymbosa var. corymbosa]
MEKIFCDVIGLFDWETFVDMKKFLHLHDRVLQWDDAAGEEAFRSVKDRFYSLVTLFVHQNKRFPNRDEVISGLHPPDDINSWADKYIDEIDWDAEVGPELLDDDPDELLDMVSQLVDTTTRKRSPEEHVVEFGDEFYEDHGFSIGRGKDFEGDLKESGNPKKSRNRRANNITLQL